MLSFFSQTNTDKITLLPSQIPFYHLIVEFALVLFIIKILMSKSTGSPGDETPLTEKEMEVNLKLAVRILIKLLLLNSFCLHFVGFLLLQYPDFENIVLQ